MSASPAPAPPSPSSSSAPAAAASTSAANANASSSAFVSTGKKAVPPPPKPTNVFTSDGSFLERFKKAADNEDKVKQEAALARKKAADARFKNRGKRPAASSTDGSSAEPAAKKVKDPDAGLTAYQREVKKLENRSLKDEGYGTRATLK